LLSLPVECREQNNIAIDNVPITVHDCLPARFVEMMKHDSGLAGLWNGTGKKSGDTSRSGYDMSLMYACIKKGITDVSDLATILALRENGSVRGNGKGTDYIRQTVMKALGKSKW